MAGHDSRQVNRVPGARERRILVFYLLLFVLVCIFFLAVWLSGTRSTRLNKSTEAVTLAINLSGALLGLDSVRRFGRKAPASLRYLALTSILALSLTSVGAVIWLVYNAAGIEVPYPSFSDVFYLLANLAWIIAIGLLFWALDTNVRDEVGPFVDLLAVTWSLTIVVISLAGVSAQSAGSLLKLVLDIVYPCISALCCALLGSIAFGPQLRRLAWPWRWFVIVLYLGWLLAFFGDIGFSITTSLSRSGSSLELFYYTGGPIDFIYALSDLLLAAAIALVPLSERLVPGETLFEPFGPGVVPGAER